MISGISIGCEDIGKNPVSEIVRRSEKPGFCEYIRLVAKILEKTRFLRLFLMPAQCYFGH